MWGLAPELVLSLAAGAALVAGWVGETFLGLPGPVAVALFLVAYVAGGWNATRSAVRAGLKGRFDIDVLMVVAALGAAALGEWAEGALLLFLFSLGHALEHYAMDRARGAIRALADLAPKTARVRREGGELEIAVGELRIGDTVIVRPGERLPADGRVVRGASSVDQAPITGESLPVAKEVDDAVFAGTINGDGSLEIETTKAAEDSTLARVVQMVESAQVAKAPSHRFTDRFQRTFTPVILTLTVLLIAVPPLFGFPFGESFIRAMILLVAASPCALALATPSAVLSGIARAARSGVLIKGGAHLENAGTAHVVVFDKTGTLTKGKPEVTDVWSTGAIGEDELLRLAAAIETRSGHPLAAAIVRAADERALQLPEVDAFDSIKGMGVRASVAGVGLLVGNLKLMSDAGIALPAALAERHEALERAGKTSMLVARDGELVGVIAVRDEPREAAKATIAALKAQGVKRTVMLTGDNRRVAEALARELGLDEVHAELLPEDKVAQIEALQERFGRVIMVGDGVNDAPALTRADVGIAMGGAGSDVALETADIALMADDLTKLPYAIALSRASRRMIVQNLVISLGVIALLVPSALLGLATIGIAIVVHESSTLVVVANALRLLGFKTRAAAV
jgi:Cd2+/Zn2+-exporting ATPase